MSLIPGAYQRSLLGHRTFIPDPLPPKLVLPTRTQKLHGEAMYHIGKVEQCRALLPNSDLLIFSSLQKEAIASSTIEGTVASSDELMLFQAGQINQREQVREVSNYASALEIGRDLLKVRPISLNLILQLHEILMSGVRGAGSAGRLKDTQNYIGSRLGDGIENAVFVPSPPEACQELLSLLEKYINGNNDEPQLVQCALTHYQFETIHPFADGNGRVGRLLVILQLIQLGMLTEPLIYPSVYFERTRSDYYKLLQAVRDEGDWVPWIDYFLQGLIDQSSETIKLTEVIRNLAAQLRTEILSIRSQASVTRVLDAFFHYPIRNIREIQLFAGVSQNTAQKAVDILMERGILYEITGKKKSRAYGCRPIFSAIFPSHP